MARLKPRPKHAPTPVVVADRVVAGLAGVGLLVALYLTATKLLSSQALFCAAGGGCDLVQSSRWSTFFGAPTCHGNAYYNTLFSDVSVRSFIDRKDELREFDHYEQENGMALFTARLR